MEVKAMNRCYIHSSISHHSQTRVTAHQSISGGKEKQSMVRFTCTRPVTYRETMLLLLLLSCFSHPTLSTP